MVPQSKPTPHCASLSVKTASLLASRLHSNFLRLTVALIFGVRLLHIICKWFALCCDVKYHENPFFLLQVKVWFQNRRTKYKRMKAEEAETKDGDKAGSSASGSDHMAEECSENGDASPHPLDCSFRDEIDIEDDDDDDDRDIEIDDDGPPLGPPLRPLQLGGSECPGSPTRPTSHIDRWLTQQHPNPV